jgi:hypothetical protein
MLEYLKLKVMCVLLIIDIFVWKAIIVILLGNIQMMIKILSFDGDYYSGKKYHGPPVRS